MLKRKGVATSGNTNMDSVEMVMSEFYHILLQLRYPEITKAEPKTIASTIFTGTDRVALLTWIIAKKSEVIAASLQKLKDNALEDELSKLYSGMGICNDKNILLGKCSMEMQLPMIKLLLEFIKTMHLDNFNNDDNLNEHIPHLMKICLEDFQDTIPASCSVKSKLNYSNAKKFVEIIQNDLNESDSLQADNTLFDNNQTALTEENYTKCVKDQEALLTTQREEFIQAFESVSSWPIHHAPYSNTTSTNTNMDTHISNICTDFSTLQKVLQAKNEICKTIIPKGLSETSTPLNQIVENIVTHTEVIRNMMK